VVDLLAIRSGHARRAGAGEHSVAVAGRRWKIFGESGLYSRCSLRKIADNHEYVLSLFLSLSDRDR